MLRNIEIAHVHLGIDCCGMNNLEPFQAIISAHMISNIDQLFQPLWVIFDIKLLLSNSGTLGTKWISPKIPRPIVRFRDNVTSRDL
jgi:hypothetical protein